MLESQRRTMLENMGLKVLQPRFMLAGAKPSVMLPLEAPIVELSATAEVVLRDDDKPPTADAGFMPKPEALFEDVQALPDFGNAGAARLLRQPVASLRCRHRLVRIGELLMLLDQPTLEWREAVPCKAFFADLYFSLVGKKYEFWADAQFDWPPVKSFPHANDRNMAQQTLHVFLHEHMQQPPCRWILVWGEAAGKLLFDKLPGIGDTDFLFDLPVLQLDHYLEYWQSPRKKHLLWQHLQVVKKALDANA